MARAPQTRQQMRQLRGPACWPSSTCVIHSAIAPFSSVMLMPPEGATPCTMPSAAFITHSTSSSGNARPSFKSVSMFLSCSNSSFPEWFTSYLAMSGSTSGRVCSHVRHTSSAVAISFFVILSPRFASSPVLGCVVQSTKLSSSSVGLLPFAASWSRSPSSSFVKFPVFVTSYLCINASNFFSRWICFQNTLRSQRACWRFGPGFSDFFAALSPACRAPGSWHPNVRDDIVFVLCCCLLS
mmetsp:Transcript_47742/g.113031  ORF Transcript_47742/g.113031 Transcript_47742/m.113031 type:complete len:240 (+) Transcript_47742:426-1145(+)